MATAKASNGVSMYSNNIGGRKNQPPPIPVSLPHISVPGNSEEDAKRSLSRCTSLPNDIDATVTVQLRNTSSRSRRKAQLQRNSVAITSSDYYNQRRPQVSQLAVKQQLHVPLRTTTAPQSLHPITESEKEEYMNKRSSMVADIHDLNGLQITDARLFRYRSNSSIAISRPTTPQITIPQVGRIKRHPSNASTINSIGRADSMLSLTDSHYTPSPGTPLRQLSSLKMNPQAVPLTAATEHQFLPLYINAESGQMYMFEDGYYVPITHDNMITFQEMSINKPPIPDRRQKDSTVSSQPQPSRRRAPPPPPSRIMTAPSDYLLFVQILIIMFTLCLNLPVLILCSLPALICSLQVRKANRNGYYEAAKKGSECVMCFSILGIIFHVFAILAVIATFLLLHFLGGYFTLQ